ncbi:VOC family protein [Micromonospora haikouensis]|uniref:VOC family protein n=1 Tax=Micromonospora TaxID=1873 RepID=UPI0035ABF2BC
MGPGRPALSVPVGTLHHVEVWVPELAEAVRCWGWLLNELGWQPFQDWSAGRSWRLGPTYLVLEESPAMTGRNHDRLAPGLHHLGFHAGRPADVDRLVAAAPAPVLPRDLAVRAPGKHLSSRYGRAESARSRGRGAREGQRGQGWGWGVLRVAGAVRPGPGRRGFGA